MFVRDIIMIDELDTILDTVRKDQLAVFMQICLTASTCSRPAKPESNRRSIWPLAQLWSFVAHNADGEQLPLQLDVSWTLC